MFDRAYASLIAAATACAAMALAVFAAGFALYAVVRPSLGDAGAAAVVALAAALVVGVVALVSYLRAQAREREAAQAHATLVESVPALLGNLTREHPYLTLAISALGGLAAARNPQLTRDLVGLLATWANRKT